MAARAPIDLDEGSYASQLHFAVKQNDVNLVRSLVSEDSTKVTSRDAVGRTPLHWALVFGNDEAAKALILNMSRSSLDSRDQQGCTPLHYASARAYTTLARVLIMRGASLNAVDAKQRTPLHYAAQQMNPEIVELLVSRGADRRRANGQGELPLDVAIKWGAMASVQCLTPEVESIATTTAEDKESVENVKNDSTSTSVPVEAKQPVKKGPSLEKLLSAWKSAETETRRKKEAELVAAHKANAALEEALRAWREVEQVNNPERHLKVDSDSDKASTSMSGSKPIGFMGLSVETGGGSSCDENDFGSISCPKRDLSWCTEWEVQENVPEEVARAQSPRERKLTPTSPWKEGNHPWVQVPTYKQTLDPSFDNTKVLRRSNSFDGSHFIIQVGGLATKLPFMSSLEVY